MSDFLTSRKVRAEAPCTGDCRTAHVREGIASLGAEAARLDRRGFLTQTMLASAALALAACGGSFGLGESMAPSSVGASIKLADYSALATVGGVAVVTLNGARLAIVRTGASSFVSLSLVCPHQGAIVATTSSGFQCPQHGATFNRTGMWIGGQPASNMRSYPTTYDATAGTIAIG